MNITHNTSWYMGDQPWITKFNEAIWLSSDGKYLEAKNVLSPLLNDTIIPKKAEIAELYGDLIYHSSGSDIDTIRMYERSLTFTPNSRVVSKIEYIKNHTKALSSSGSSSNSDSQKKSTSSGVTQRETKKEELKKIATERSLYLRNTDTYASESRSTLEQLIQSAENGTVDVVQDW